MKLKTKLIVVACLSVLMPALLFAASGWALYSSSKALTRIHHENMEPAVLLGRIDAMLKNSRGHINAGYVHNPAVAASRLHTHPITLHSSNIRSTIKDVQVLWQDFRRKPHSPAEQAHIETIDAGMGDYIAKTLQPAADALDAADYERAVMVVTTTFKSYRGIEEAISSLQKLADEGARSELERAQAQLYKLGLIALGVAVLGTALGLVFIWATQRSIQRSVQATQRLSEQLRQGELRAIAVPAGQDELLDICHSLNGTVASLAEVMQRVQASARRVNAGAGAIAIGSADLSGRTESQAGALEQTAAAIEQLQGAVAQTSQHAAQAVHLAQQACQVASRAGAVVGEVVQTMQQINESSRRVGDITSVIDGIAFQTNILALNAAVEAARAGDHGRGFAVVAAEVRSLAQRAAQAAREIKALIGTSVERVAEGGELVDQARDTMSGVVTAITQTAQLLGQISNASHEQRDGVLQISEAVHSLDQSTQHNARLATESAAAADGLNGEAEKVLQAVAYFHFDASEAPRS
ncbi:MAG: Tar ligand binding domain-containing protein [Burkholderiaceae bacterium]|nr:Tar ligand binding domain-containing protein [Burkholderiaceae bacterium]